jgi:predicted neutral ceramidase superfamily lipid hydrolase
MGESLLQCLAAGGNATPPRITDLCCWHRFFAEISNQNIFYMRSLLYLIAIILIIGWVLGFFVYSAGALIHALLVLAIIAILLSIIRGRSPVE